MATKEKRKHLALDIRCFTGEDGATYVVFKTPKGNYHAFKEVEAKEAARQCGAPKKPHTNQMWDALWKTK